jgi:hypothetical protein
MNKKYAVQSTDLAWLLKITEKHEAGYETGTVLFEHPEMSLVVLSMEEFRELCRMAAEPDNTPVGEITKLIEPGDWRDYYVIGSDQPAVATTPSLEAIRKMKIIDRLRTNGLLEAKDVVPGYGREWEGTVYRVSPVTNKGVWTVWFYPAVALDSEAV